MKDTNLVQVLSELFTPTGVLVVVTILGVFTTLYTSIIKFVYDKKLKTIEGQHAEKLAQFKAQLDQQNQLLVETMKADSNTALKKLEAELTARNQRELQQLQAVSAEEQARSNARRDYEDEARKRLYHECEPLVFELLEFSQNAVDRIHSLARTARHGNLPAWLNDDKYYIASTLYYLLAPVAVHKLMRRRLTVVDITLDQNIAAHYRLSKQLAWSFADDHKLAWGLHVNELHYRPDVTDWQIQRVTNEAEYWRQGLPFGRLDNAVEALIVRDHEPDGELRIKSFGEFELEFHQPATPVAETFKIVQDIFKGFHPITRPILWRVLVAQAHIYSAIVGFHESSGRTLVVSPIRDRERFYWEKDPSDADKKKMEVPFVVAEEYFNQRLPELWRR